MQLADDARLFLLDVYEKNIPICFVTDLTAAIQLRKVGKLGLEKMVKFMVSSEEAGVEKPDETMFKLAAEKLKLSYPDLIMIGDSEKKDIAGAEALGIKAYKVEFIFD
jgi:putative hydrolase of the HAD superfamily